ncbi:MAG: YitT family protein [Lachnospiraceae bacterium]|nr:YitT family protein [Lachnospiraceae bacterium]
MKDRLQNRDALRWIQCLGGATIYAVALNLFVVPAHLYSSGIMGVSQLIRSILNLCGLTFGNYDIAGILYYMINVPIMIMAYKEVGKSFWLKTMANMTLVTVLLLVVPIPTQLLVTNDRVTSCIIGGLVCGMGSGIALLGGGSCGGADIIGIWLIKKQHNASVGKVNLSVNFIVYAVSLCLYGVETVIYSMVYAGSFMLSMDKVHSQNINCEVIIISKIDTKEMEQDLMKSLYRGITKIDGSGAYTGADAQILLIVLSKYELGQLKRIVRSYDPRAFVIVTDHVSVEGNYLKKV